MIHDNTIALIAPGLISIIHRECDILNLSDVVVSPDFDKLIVSRGEKSIGISYESIRMAFEQDDYTAIDRAASAAVRYLKDRSDGL